jgi:stage II sporulation protein P
MKFVLKTIAVALTAVITVNPPASLNLLNPNIETQSTQETQPVAINNGSLMLYLPVSEEPQKQEELPFYEDNLVAAEPTEIEEPAISVLTRNISAAREDLSIFSARDAKIVNRTFSAGRGENYINLSGGGQIRNTTQIPNSVIKREVAKPLTFNLGEAEQTSAGSAPVVLIVHTHTSESFIPQNNGYYDSAFSFRSQDPRQNIVAVGAKIAEEIAKSGFGVIHDGTVHDFPVYSGGYRRSAETIQAILDEFPSIQIVLDVHRDAIEENDRPVAAVAAINDTTAAQIMLISAADNAEGEWGVPDFKQNLRFAARLQSQLETDHKGLTRAVLFQYSNYNQHLSAGALLVEIGSHGNTLEQALYSAELLGQSIGRLLDTHGN